jgi:hypothetical protein
MTNQTPNDFLTALITEAGNRKGLRVTPPTTLGNATGMSCQSAARELSATLEHAATPATLTLFDPGNPGDCFRFTWSGAGWRSPVGVLTNETLARFCCASLLEL